MPLALLLLAGGLAANVLLGPLGLGLLRWRVSPNGLNQTYGADAASLALAVLTPIVAALAALTVALLASYARGNTTTTAAHPTGAAGGGHRPQAERHHARAIRPGRPHGGQPDGRRRRMSSVNEAKSE